MAVKDVSDIKFAILEKQCSKVKLLNYFIINFRFKKIHKL